MSEKPVQEKIPFSEVIESKPVRHEITKDKRILFELPDGKIVAMACDHKREGKECGNIYWDIGVKKENDQLVFRLICHACGGMYFQSMRKGR